MNFYDGLSFPFAAPVADGHYRKQTPLYYGIQFNETGTLHLRIGNGRSRILRSAWCFITYPGTEFEYRIPSGEKHGYHAVCFIGPRVDSYLKSGLLNLTQEPIKIHFPVRFRETIHALEDYRKLGKNDFAVLCLENLLLQIQDVVSYAKNPIWQTDALESLAAKIQRKPSDKWDFEEEAEKLHVTLRHFRRLFKQVLGESPGHLLIRSRLELAARELAQTREAVRQIASNAGFEDEFHFSHLFKKYYHLSPKDYRAEFFQF